MLWQYQSEQGEACNNECYKNNAHTSTHLHSYTCTQAHMYAQTHTQAHQHTLMFRWWCSLHSVVLAVVCRWAPQKAPKLTEPPPSASAVPQVCGPTREAFMWLSLMSTERSRSGWKGKRREEVEEEMIRMREMSGGGVGVGVRDRAKRGSGNVRTYCINTSRKEVPHQRKELHFTDTVIQKPLVKERNGFQFLITLNLLLQLHHPLSIKQVG